MKRLLIASAALALLIGGLVARADYQVRDGNGNIVTIKAGTTGGGETLPQSNPSDPTGNSLFTSTNPGYTQPAAPPADVRPASPGQITIVDSGSASASGQNGVSFITGTPSANSTAAFTLNGQDAVRIEVNGTWAGALEFETSADGGLSWVPTHCQVVGTVKLATSVTANGDLLCPVGGSTNARMRATAFSSGVASIWANFTGAPGPVLVVSPRVMALTEGTDATYHAALSFAPAASATDVVLMQGSSTRTIRIRRIMLGGLASSAADVQVSAVRRSAGDTGGTSTGVTPGKADINDGTPTAQVSTYTANPSSLGASGGGIFNLPMAVATATTATADRLIMPFGDYGAKSLVLRGTTDYLAINLNGATLSNLFGDIEWTEEQ